jgi:ATP-dependent DNA helicase RecQ
MRNLAASTIEGHLSYYIFTGAIGISEMVDEQKKLLIRNAVESYGGEKLGPLKEVLGEEHSYGEIKAVIAWMRREGTI